MAQTVKTTRRVALSKLKPYPRNPRRGDVAAIAASLRAHGQYRALVVNKDGTVLAGNHTPAALEEIGAKDALCHYVDVSEHEAAKIVLADNRTNDLASYDEAELAELLSSLPDLDGTGYSDKELVQFMASSSPAPKPDPPPAAPTHESAAGEVWLLGSHRLVCGEEHPEYCDAIVERFERDTGETAILED